MNNEALKTIRLYDTLLGEKVPFEPRDPGKVNMYVCGLTPSNYPHIGHARTAVVFDVIQRIFLYFGYKVNYCSNFTDIDDKIIAKANEEGCSPKDLAQKYIQIYLESLETLNIKPPGCFAKVTDHISEIIEMVEVLISKGFAYESGGDVYFSVRSFKPYGKLSKRSIKELLVGARIEPGEKKRDPLDFALWKAAKPGEPSWESPWGKGRPGWHIECSAMSLKYLGGSFDIHGGAQDLIFPHHENEIAQAEAYSGIEPFSKYWIHAGWVTLNKEKMSKSIGNVFKLSEALSLVHPNVLRYFFISTLYSSPLDYDVKNLHQAAKSLERIVLTIKRLFDYSSSAQKVKTGADSILEKWRNDFDEALADNFNTPQAIGVIMHAVKEINRWIKELTLSKEDANFWYHQMNTWMEILGFNEVENTNFALFSEEEIVAKLKDLMNKHKIDVDEQQSLDEMIKALVNLRKKCREEKQFVLSDQIRNELFQLNIVLEDTKEGTTYRFSEELQ